ncbi:hypothetical protein AALA21_06235 [Eggerthellaceae bacterium 3-80]|nr:hypothetical protein D7W09_05730 [bacterium D16-34]
MQGSILHKIRAFARPFIEELKYNAGISGASLKFNIVVLAVCALLFFILDGFLIAAVTSAYPGSLGSYLLQCHTIDALGGCAFMAYTNLLLNLVKPDVCLKRPISVFIYMLFCGIFWEAIAPLFVPNSTGDVLDVVAYLIGAFCYLLLAKMHGNVAGEGVTDHERRGITESAD